MKPAIAPTACLLISHGSRDPRPQAAMDRLADMVRKRWEVKKGSQHSCFGIPVASAPSSPLASGVLLDLPADAGGKANGRKRTENDAGNIALLTRPQVTLSALSESAATPTLVGTACLELSAIPLRQQIYEFGLRAKAAGARELKLLPVFLMPGVHVMEDIPAEVAAARHLLGDSLALALCPHLGSRCEVAEVLASRLAAAPAEGSLLVAHGSRRPKGNRAIRELAKRLNTTVAYWSTPPDIETQVISLMQQGCQYLTILPYFLFAGGITDAIIHRTEELAERFPKVKFRLLPTLGATDEIADIAIALIDSHA